MLIYHQLLEQPSSIVLNFTINFKCGWENKSFRPKAMGWEQLMPVKTDMPPAPEDLLDAPTRGMDWSALLHVVNGKDLVFLTPRPLGEAWTTDVNVNSVCTCDF